MTFYELLKEKASDPKYKDKVVMIGRLTRIDGKDNHRLLTYADILDLVDRIAVSLIKEAPITENDVGKPKFVVVNNSINSAIMVLALLKLGVLPVLIDSKTLDVDGSPLLPFVYSREADNLKDDASIIIDGYIKHHFPTDDFLPKDVKNGNIVIFSSGSEGYNPHYNVVSEKTLIDLPNQYGENGSRFYSYISCANISGLLTNIVNPLVNDCTVILNESFNIDNFRYKTDTIDTVIFSEKKKSDRRNYVFSCHDIEFMYYLFLKLNPDDKIYIYNNKVAVITSSNNTALVEYRPAKQDFVIDTLMFPRNIVEYLKSVDKKDADFSKVKRIYLTGGVNSSDTITEIREMLPSIPEGVFTNLYGSTEANGVICSCDEKDLKTCYIDITKYNSGEVYYTYDRKNIYRIKDGVIKKIRAAFGDFDFNAYLSVSNGVVPNVVIDGMDIKRKNNDELEETGDLGIYIDNRLYVLGRKSDLLITKDKIHDIKRIEKRYQRLLGVPTYCVKDPSQDKVYLFICYEKDDFGKGISLYEKAWKFRNMADKDLVMPPVLLNDNIFPMSTISGKVSKAKLLEFAKYSEIQEKNFKEYYLDLQPERRCAEEFINRYFSGSTNAYDQDTFFPGAKASKLEDDLCFTVSMQGSFISAFFDRISYLFDILEIDDTAKTMKLRVLPQILFFTREEFYKGLPILNNSMNFRLLIISLIKENKEEIEKWSFVPIEQKNEYTFDDLKQLARNFILCYKNYLASLGFTEIEYFPEEESRIKLTKERHDQIISLLKKE